MLANEMFYFTVKWTRVPSLTLMFVASIMLFDKAPFTLLAPIVTTLVVLGSRRRLGGRSSETEGATYLSGAILIGWASFMFTG